MKRRQFRTIALMALCAGVAACQPRGEEPLAETGIQSYRALCVDCHGPGARGDGPRAGTLAVAPPDLTRIAARNGGSFPEEDVMAVIFGYPGRYHLGLMPEFGPQMMQSEVIDWEAPSGEVIPTPVRLIAVMEYLRTIQSP